MRSQINFAPGGSMDGVKQVGPSPNPDPTLMTSRPVRLSRALTLTSPSPGPYP